MRKLFIIFIVIITLFLIALNIKSKSSNSKVDSPLNSIDQSIVKISSSNEEYNKDGYGFIYKFEYNKSYVITNYHVISACKDVIIKLEDNNIYNAEVINYDEYSDIAILSIPYSNNNLLKMSTSNVYEKDIVFVKNSNDKILGQVLSKNVEINISNSHYDAIAVDIDVDSGYSGSPLFNNDAEVIGIISARDKSKVYVIPISYALDIANKLESGVIERPNLGATFTNTTNTELINEYNISNDIDGVVILNITEGFPLSNAGIEEGSIITKLNDKAIKNVNELRNELYKYNVGDSITIEVYLNGENKKVNLYLNK